MKKSIAKLDIDASDYAASIEAVKANLDKFE